MPRDSSLLEAAARIQAASWKENGRAEVIEAACQQIGAIGGVLLNFKTSDGSIENIASHGLPSVEQKYVDEIAENPNISNPHVAYSLSREFAHTTCDYNVMDERAILKDGLYDWLQRACHVKYFIGSRLTGPGVDVLLLGLHFTAKQGHASEQQIRHAEMLRPHLAIAFRTVELREKANDAMTFAELIGASLPHGLIGLNQSARCVLLNEAADEILQHNDGLTINSLGELVIADRQAASKVGNLMGEAIRASVDGALFAGGVVSVRRASQRRNYRIRVSPGLRLRYGYDVGIPAVIVMISDPDARLAVDRQEVVRAFGLTNREVDVVSGLLVGETLRDTAAGMGIAYNTARVHLQNICRKMDCHSQAEIVNVVGRLFPKANRIRPFQK